MNTVLLNGTDILIATTLKYEVWLNCWRSVFTTPFRVVYVSAHQSKYNNKVKKFQVVPVIFLILMGLA